MELLQLLGSFASVLIVAFIAKRLFPETQPLNNERIINNIERYCPTIPIGTIKNAQTFISDDQNKALVVFTEARFGMAVLLQLGDRVVVRHFEKNSPIHITETTVGLTVNPKDFTMPAMNLSLAGNTKSNAVRVLESHNLMGTTPRERSAHA